MLAAARKPVAFMAAARLLASKQAAWADVSIIPRMLFGGAEQSLVSMMVSTSHDLLAADLVFEDLCLV